MPYATPLSIPDVTEKEFQRHWLALLAERTAAEDIAHAAVARELEIPEDLYYKYRTGKRKIRSWIFVKLCRRFSLPTCPEELEGRRICFDSPFAGLLSGRERLDRYVGVIRELTAALAQGSGATEVCVSTTDAPVPYFFAYPTLRAVKLYFFAASEEGFAWPTLDQLMRQVRDHDALPDIARAYLASRRTEIWGPRPLDSIGHQLRHLHSVGALSPEEYAEALRELGRLVDDLEARLTGGCDGLRLFLDGSASRSPRFILEAGPRSRALVTDDPPYFSVTDDVTTLDITRRAFRNRLSIASDVNERGQLSVGRFTRLLREGLSTSVAAAAPAYA